MKFETFNVTIRITVPVDSHGVPQTLPDELAASIVQEWMDHRTYDCGVETPHDVEVAGSYTTTFDPSSVEPDVLDRIERQWFDEDV
jgi:hypothetical protein